MIVLLALLGLRPSELCNMKAGEIVTDTDHFGAKETSFKPFHHKTKWKGKSRTVPLGDVELAIIQKYLPGKGEHKYLFCNLERFKETPLTTATFGRFISKAIKKHGLNKFTPYQIRHTNATWVSKMLDRDHARAQMGHTTEAMTQKYDHADSEKKKAVLVKRKSAGYVLSPKVIARYGNAPTPRRTFLWFLCLPVILFVALWHRLANDRAAR